MLTDVQPSGGVSFMDGTNYEIIVVGEDAADNATKVLKGTFTADTSPPSFTGTPAASFVAAGASSDDIQDLNITFDAIGEDATLYWLVRAASEADLEDNPASIGMVKDATPQLDYGAGDNAGVAAGVMAVTTGTISPDCGRINEYCSRHHDRCVCGLDGQHW